MRRFVPAILVVALAAAACGSAPAPSNPVSSGLSAVAADSASPAAGQPTATPSDTRGPAATAAIGLAPSPGPTRLPPTEAPPTEPPPTEPPPSGEAAEPAATPTQRPAARLALSLAAQADFVPQYTFEWCVGASIQMTRSIVTGDREESRTSQRRYWEMARDRTIGSPYGGANPAGWTAALNDLDVGPYRLVSLPTFDEALTRAARALAQTGRPVGLVMWAGRHAWVMTGYEATGDPVRDKGARVTRVRVMDPLYPHGSRWGPSPEPNQLVSRKALARQFVLRDRPDYDFGMEPGWLLVLPVR